MKANRLILSAIVAIMGVMSTIAQDIVSIDSIHLLSMEQKQTIQFVKKQLNQDKTGLELPLEVNYLLGDTITKTNYKVKPKWEDAYFIKADSVVMIVPLYNESLNLLQCQLRVENTAQNVFFQQIETLIGTSNEENDKFTGSMVYSNNLGNLIKIYSFENGECTEIVRNNIVYGTQSYVENKKSNNKSEYNDLSGKTIRRVNNLEKPRGINRLEIKNGIIKP
ncbi:MAG: hypothetical protein E7080_07000 [Bacteroidales bacterium]|nr:hypothetical protein [Bacteroidales bacterium]